jgi:hypothetical protein
MSDSTDVGIIKTLLNDLIDDVYNKIYNHVEEQFKEIHKKIESYEQQIATIVLAYGEQAVFMEALVGQIAFASKEAQDAFQEQLTKGRKQMLEVMNDASAGFVADQDPGLGKAIGDLAKEKLSNTDQ